MTTRWRDTVGLALPHRIDGLVHVGASCETYGVMDDASTDFPAQLTLDEAFRAAFYLVLAYYRRGEGKGGDVELLVDYLWSDPARWDDWREAVRRALDDDGVANPDHDGRWEVRPPWPA